MSETENDSGIYAIDVDMLSQKAACGSVRSDLLSPSKESNSSTPYTGSPTPFAIKAEGIAAWTDGSAKFDGGYWLGIESLIPKNSEEAKSIAYPRVLEMLYSFDREFEHAQSLPSSTATVSRRHHVDAHGGQRNAYAAPPTPENVSSKIPEGPFIDVFGSMKLALDDPEKQELVDFPRVTQRNDRYEADHPVSVIALGLGIVLYKLWTW